MDPNTNTQSHDQSNDQNAQGKDTGTNVGRHGSGTRDSLWFSRVTRPVAEILQSADVAGITADVDLLRATPLVGIEQALNAYRADGSPDALVLIAAFARQEFVNPSAGHATTGRDGSNITGHSAR